MYGASSLMPLLCCTYGCRVIIVKHSFTTKRAHIGQSIAIEAFSYIV